MHKVHGRAEMAALRLQARLPLQMCIRTPPVFPYVGKLRDQAPHGAGDGVNLVWLHTTVILQLRVVMPLAYLCAQFQSHQMGNASGQGTPASAAGSRANVGQMLEQGSATGGGGGGGVEEQQRQQQQQQQKQQQQQQKGKGRMSGSDDGTRAAAVKAAMVHAWTGCLPGPINPPPFPLRAPAEHLLSRRHATAHG